MLLKAEVLLARAGFSPGVIDGTPGTNLRHAVAAFASAQGLQSDGEITPAVWAALNAPGAQPVAATYTVDGAGHRRTLLPRRRRGSVEALQASTMPATRTPLEMLAERFHMSQEALQALNPGADVGKPGTVLAVAQVGDVTLPKIDHIQVDKANAAVNAYDKADKLIAFAPATVGSDGSAVAVRHAQGQGRRPRSDLRLRPEEADLGSEEARQVHRALRPEQPGRLGLDRLGRTQLRPARLARTAS